MKKQISVMLSLAVIAAVGMGTMSFSEQLVSEKEIETMHISGSLPDFPMDFLAQKSIYAIKGTVTEIKSVPMQYDVVGNPLIFTDAVIDVERDVHKNYDGKQITVRSLGGVADNKKLISEASPSFEVGEKVLVFVSEKEPDSIFGDNYFLAGWKLGKYYLSDGNAHHEKADRSMSEASLITEIQKAKSEKRYN